MDTQPALTHHLVTKMQRALRTGGSSTIDVGHLYIQTAGYGEGMVMVETTSNEFLPRGHQLSRAAMGRLVELGFTNPDDDFPNWWIGLEDATDADIETAATAVITALVEVYGLTPATIALAFGVEPDNPRPAPAAAASEGQQVPNRAQLKRLKQRLALAESFCLEAVRTGIIPNTTAPHRMRELMEK